MAITEATIFDKIAYFHGSKHWDAHWQSIPDFSLHPDLAHVLNPTQSQSKLNSKCIFLMFLAALVGKHLRQIGEYYAAMDAAGFFSKTAGELRWAEFCCIPAMRPLPDFLTSVFRSTHPDRPLNPTSVFGAGFSGFDRIDERGWDRAGYTHTKNHSPDDWELRSSYQIAYFITLGRIFQVSTHSYRKLPI
jgi:hypothetical protein